MPENIIDFRPTVVDTDDEGLRHYIHERHKVFAKFTEKGCVICEQLSPGFGKFANDDANRDILFIRLDSGQNPVAKKLMAEQAAPFFVSYCRGRMLECNALTTDADVQAQLSRLRAYTS